MPDITITAAAPAPSTAPAGPRAIPCPVCYAPAGQPCTDDNFLHTMPHQERRAALAIPGALPTSVTMDAIRLAYATDPQRNAAAFDAAGLASLATAAPAPPETLAAAVADIWGWLDAAVYPTAIRRAFGAAGGADNLRWHAAYYAALPLLAPGNADMPEPNRVAHAVAMATLTTPAFDGLPPANIAYELAYRTAFGCSPAAAELAGAAPA